MQYSEIQELYALFSSLQTIPFSSIKLSLEILQFFEQIQPIEQRRLAVQNKIIEQYGHQNEDGSFSVGPADEQYFEFVKKYNELLVTEVEVKKPNLVLDDFDGIVLTPNQVKSLRSLLTINL